MSIDSGSELGARLTLAARGLRGAISRASDELHFARVLKDAGMLAVDDPRDVAATARDVHRFGMLGAVTAATARRFGSGVALVDEGGELTYAELDGMVNGLAGALRERGVRGGDGVALLARNHRGFVLALFAAARLGARVILLNTDFAGPQIREVTEREGADLLILDAEYSSLLEGVEPRLGTLESWADAGGESELERLASSRPWVPPPAPGQRARLIVLTSGTTGTPKGAPRQEPRSLAPAGAVLSKVPFRAGETMVVCAPLFHALGLAHSILGVGLGSTLVLRRRFDPGLALRDMSDRRASSVIVVPVMLRRILDLGPRAREGLDLSSLRIVLVGGSQLGDELCRRALDAFGPVVHNLYGSTEVAYATVATPEELVAAPDTVGTPPRGAVVRLYDERDEPIEAPHATGRIFVGNGFEFEGYTGGGHKDSIDGLFATGDVGHFDEAGRLFVDGRDDEMIVSGGENVYPAEVEELLLHHERIADAAVIGVADPEWGGRLRAFVVATPGAELDADEVRSFVRENLARYKVPRDVEFLEELPRNPSGKVLKRELAQI